MRTIDVQFFSCALGELILGAIDDRLCLCDWRYRKMRGTIDRRLCRFFNAEYRMSEHKAITQAIDQLTDFFESKRKDLSLPLWLAGSEFQRQVWVLVSEIPFASTVSYGHLAKQLGSPNALRAVANANGANALAFFIPCHRVVGADGSLVGYAGGLKAKSQLLRLEQSVA